MNLLQPSVLLFGKNALGRLPAIGRAMVAQRSILLRQPRIHPAKVDLAGTVAPLLSAQRTCHDDVVSREGLDAGGHGTGTSLAGHDETSPAAGERLRGVVRTHGRSLGRSGR